MSPVKDKVLILVADDEPNLLLLMKDNLEENGYEVACAANGEEALQRFMTEKPSLILLDIEMPRMNGWEVCERIRNTPGISQVPILFLSAYAQQEDIKRGLALGVSGYVPKPFKMRELLQTIRTLLVP